MPVWHPLILSRPRAPGGDAAETAIARPDNAGDVSPLCVGSAECYRVETLARISGSVSTLVRTSDRRLLFIEDGQRVRIVEDDVLAPEPALTAAASAVLTGLVLDPAFADTRLVYVGVVEESSGGNRQLSIVRYREVANALGEGAVIVAGLPLPATGTPSLAVDAARRLYVAMPAAPPGDPRPDRYAGMVLRFESDGTAVRDDGVDAPIFSRGYAQPTALAWTGMGNDSVAVWNSRGRGRCAGASVAESCVRWVCGGSRERRPCYGLRRGESQCPGLDLRAGARHRCPCGPGSCR